MARTLPISAEQPPESVRWRRRELGALRRSILSCPGRYGGADIPSFLVTTRFAAPRSPGRPGCQRRRPRPRSGSSPNMVSLNKVLADGDEVL